MDLDLGKSGYPVDMFHQITCGKDRFDRMFYIDVVRSNYIDPETNKPFYDHLLAPQINADNLLINLFCT